MTDEQRKQIEDEIKARNALMNEYSSTGYTARDVNMVMFGLSLSRRQEADRIKELEDSIKEIYKRWDMCFDFNPALEMLPYTGELLKSIETAKQLLTPTNNDKEQG